MCVLFEAFGTLNQFFRGKKAISIQLFKQQNKCTLDSKFKLT